MTARLAKQPALCAGFLAVLLSPVLADGADLPAGGQVTAGSATIASSGGQMLVNQASPRAVIDWNSFDIGQQSSVTFDMPGTSAAILNRVISGTPTTIAGSITANGQVFLVNPNGIAITGTGAVKVGGGFTASTLDLHNDDFMEGRLNFSGDSPASITHAGRIETGDGGFAALLAHGGIDNQGLISVPMGRVALGTGSAITLDPTGTGFMQILAPAIGEDSGTIRSSGKINAEAGRVEIKAASAAKAVRDIVNVSGEVSVASVRKQGGTIILDSGSSHLRLSGKLDASSRQAKGGRVAVGGKRLALEGARIEATGTSGGMVIVGGGRRGDTVPGLTTASAVSIDEASIIDASALAEGGGEVIVWSDDDTRFFGSIFATGIGGDGGAAEVSSLGTYAFSGRVNLLSAEGRAGDLLLDPYDVVISSAADANHTGFTATGSGAVINAASLEAALAGASVTVLTGSSGSEAGTITVESPISWNANTTLTLDAAGNIILNAPIAASGTGSGLILTAAGAGGISGGGNIASNSTLTFNVNAADATGIHTGVISGTGQLVKGGPGLLTLAGTNSYTGATTINSGTLRAGSSTALGLTSYTAISGTFDMAGYAADIGGVAGMGLITNSGGAATLTLGRGTVSRAFGGTIEDGASSISILKIGSAAQTLDGPNRFTGSITVSSAIFQVRGAGGLNNGNYAGDITISAGASLRYSSATNQTLSGNISGAGTLTKDSSTSVLTLSNASGLTGSLNITAGTVRAGSANGFGSAAASVGSGTTLDLAGFSLTIGYLQDSGIVTNSGAAATLTTGTNTSASNPIWSGSIRDGAGTISVVKVGSGWWSLSGANTYTGSTTISGGILQIAGDASITGDIINHATLIFNTTTGRTHAGNISGTGRLEKLNTGSLTLSGANSYTGITFVNQGTLRAGSTSAFGSNSAINLSPNNPTLDLAGYSLTIGSLVGTGTSTVTNSGVAATLTTGTLNTSTSFSGVLQNGTGTLALTKTGTGALTLTGTNTYTGQTTISGGTLALGGTGTIVSDIAVGAGTTLSFATGTSFTYGGVISGSGSMNFSRGMTFTGNNTFTGNSAVCTGCTIAVGTGGTSGTLGGTISFNSGANFIFNRADTSIFAGSAGGRVNIIKNGGGTLIVTGSLVSLNGTTINAGTLQIGDGGTMGSVSTTTITNNGALVFNRSDALTLSDAISGTGSLTKQGSGTLTLTGSNTYTGATIITSGTLKAGSSTAFGSNSALTVSGGASLDLGGFSTSIGSLSGGGTVTNSGSAATLTEGSSNANTTFSGILQNGTGTVALGKTGTGTLILTGANTYSGGTTVHAGATLQMGNGGSTGIVTGNIANSGSVILNTSANGWFNGFSISGTGSFTKAGTGNVLTSVNHAYTGETIVRNGELWFVGVLPKGNLNVEAGAFNFQPGAGVFTYNGVIIGAGTVRSYTNGTLTLTADSPFSGFIRVISGNIQLGNGGTSGNMAGSVNIVSGGSLTFNRSDDFIYSGSLGGGSLIKGGAGKLVATGLLSTTGTSINEGTLQIGDGGTTGSISGNIANSAALVFNRSDALTYSGSISGTGTLTQSGTGTLTLSGANSYTGATTVTSGTLKAGSSTSFGSNSALTVSGSASLDLGGVSISIGSLSGGGTITNSGAAATLTEGSLNASTTFSGVLQNGTGTLSLVKMGTGRLILTGASTFTGGTVVNAGSTLQFGAGGAALGSIAGSITNNGTVIVDTTTHGNFYTVMTGSGSFIKRGTATMYAMNNHQYTGDMTVESGMLWFVNGLPQGNMIIGSTGQVDAQLSTSMSYNGLISGSGTLGKRGAGTLTLTANSPFTGAILVRGGNVQIGNGGTSGNIAGPILFQGGNSLTFDRSDGFTFAGAVTGGSLVKNGAGTMVATGALAPTSTTISGGTLQIGDGGTSGSLSGSIMNNAALVFNRSNAVTHSGAVSGTGSLTQAGTGTLTLSGVNSYTGATTVMSGKLKAGSATAFGSNSALTVSSGGSLDLGGFSASIGSLAGAGTVTNSGAAATLTAGDNNTSTTFSGSLQNGAGVMSLVKTGTGTLTLTGDNTHTGLTVIDTGLLALAGSWNAGSTASLEIASGASLVASGTLTAGMLSIGGEGSAALNGANMIGALESSSAIGSLSLNNAQSLILASVQARGTLNLTLSGTSSDLTIGAGAIISSEAAGDAIALSAHHFINNSGAGAISTPNGRWLVYLPSPAGSSFNGLNSGNTAIWNTASGAAVMQQGTRYVFAANPTLNVTSRNVTKTYGDDVSAQIPSAYTITGFAPGMAGAYLPDSEATALSGAPAVISAGGGAAAAAGTYQIEVAQGSLASLTGYGLTFSSTGQLTVDRAALTVAARDASKTYDGLAFSGGNGVTYQGFVAGETEAVLSGSLVYGGAAQGAVNAGTYGLTASGLASGNYDISYAGGQLTVDRAALTVRARDAAKTYDGLAFSGGNGVTYQGFVAAETEAVLSGSLVYGGAAQGAVNAGTYGLTVSGLTSVNYDISYARGLLTVDRAALTVVARDASKTYDGLAFSGGNGVTYQGFVAGETEAVLSGSLVYGGAAQGAVNAGAYGLTVSGLASENYDIAYLGGVLVIEAAVAPAPQPGTESVRIVKSDPGWMGLVTQNTCCLASPRMRYGQEWLPETDIIAPWLIEPLEEIAERY